jgi:hypothetical protein
MGGKMDVGATHLGVEGLMAILEVHVGVLG